MPECRCTCLKSLVGSTQVLLVWLHWATLRTAISFLPTPQLQRSQHVPATEPHPCHSPEQVCVMLLGHPPPPHLQGAPAGQQQQLSPTRSTSRYSSLSARASLEDIAGPGAMPSVMRWESLGALENLLENEPMSSAAGGLKPLKSNSFSALTAAFRAAGVNVVAGDEGDAQDALKVRCVCTMGVGCL